MVTTQFRHQTIWLALRFRRRGGKGVYKGVVILVDLRRWGGWAVRITESQLS